MEQLQNGCFRVVILICILSKELLFIFFFSLELIIGFYRSGPRMDLPVLDFVIEAVL